jgi:hypothetical protein
MGKAKNATKRRQTFNTESFFGMKVARLNFFSNILIQTKCLSDWPLNGKKAKNCL